MKPLTPPPLAWLSRCEKAGLAAFLLLILGFGVLVEFRSAFLQKRKTDLNVYLRAAWAVRAGENPYDFTTVGHPADTAGGQALRHGWAGHLSLRSECGPLVRPRCARRSLVHTPAGRRPG